MIDEQNPHAIEEITAAIVLRKILTESYRENMVQFVTCCRRKPPKGNKQMEKVKALQFLSCVTKKTRKEQEEKFYKGKVKKQS